MKEESQIKPHRAAKRRHSSPLEGSTAMPTSLAPMGDYQFFLIRRI